MSDDEEAYMDLQPVNYLRLLPPPPSYGTDYATGVMVFLGSIENEDAYALTMCESDARRLASEIEAHYRGEINIANPNDNYGRV